MPNVSLDLLDINVWLALVDPDHAHHDRARLYWEKQSAEQIAFCRISMLGFLRLITHHKVMGGNPMTPREAWDAYLVLRSLPEVIFLPEPLEIEGFLSTRLDSAEFPPHLWTDAYLSSFALIHDLRLVSFDSDYHRFPDLHFLHLQNEPS